MCDVSGAHMQVGTAGETSHNFVRNPANWVVRAVPGLLTLLFCLFGIGHPVLWQDELATLSASTRSVEDIFRLARH
jgi:hypothetical protein